MQPQVFYSTKNLTSKNEGWTTFPFPVYMHKFGVTVSEQHVKTTGKKMRGKMPIQIMLSPSLRQMNMKGKRSRGPSPLPPNPVSNKKKRFAG